jgi:hypothetical protein
VEYQVIEDMSDERTIAALKTNFLRQQIRILSQPLKLSEKAKERAGVPDGKLEDVMLQGMLLGLQVHIIQNVIIDLW